jgi:predicted metal-dependent HD superfamily phosphohydrolase
MWEAIDVYSKADLCRERWNALLQKAGAKTSPSKWYDTLTAAYAEPQRHYHNQQHIAACLAEFDIARTLAQHATAVELALWFHDAVYDPRAHDNEERSAALLKQCAIEVGLPPLLTQTASNLVMATKTHSVGDDADAALIVDIDLSILGAEPKRFSEYEDQIRLEYAWVPEAVFASKRAEILEKFLARDRIFTTQRFYQKYERQARRNLAASVNNLRQLTS